MIPYLFLFILGSFVYFSDTNVSSKKKLLFFILAMVLISGLRDMIGGFDVYIYGEVFEARDKIGDFRLFEFGFNKYNQILYFINTSREFMFFATALLMISLHCFVLNKISVQPNMAVYLYFCKFFLFTFVYLRQGLGMVVIWFAILALFKNNRILTLLLIIISYYFHKSAIFIIPFVFITNKKFSNFQIFTSFIFFMLVSLSPLGSFLTLFFAENVDSKYAGYSTRFSGVNIFYLIETGLLIYLLVTFKKKFYNINKGLFIYNGMFIYICLQLMGLTNATFVRLGWYYLIFLILFLTNIYLFIENKSKQKNYRVMVYAYFSLVFIKLLLSYDAGDLMPYKFFFQDFDRNGMWDWMEYRR